MKEWDGVEWGLVSLLCSFDHMYRGEMIYLLVINDLFKICLSHLFDRNSWSHLPNFHPNCLFYNKEMEIHLFRDYIW